MGRARPRKLRQYRRPHAKPIGAQDRVVPVFRENSADATMAGSPLFESSIPASARKWRRATCLSRELCHRPTARVRFPASRGLDDKKHRARDPVASSGLGRGVRGGGRGGRRSPVGRRNEDDPGVPIACAAGNRRWHRSSLVTRVYGRPALQSPIVTLTVNPCIDESAAVDRVIPDRKLRCGPARYEPGGGESTWPGRSGGSGARRSRSTRRAARRETSCRRFSRRRGFRNVRYRSPA